MTFKPWIFCSLEKRFFVLEYRKTHFPGLYCLENKKMEKWPICDQNHGLPALKKISIFRIFWIFFWIFYSLERRYFVLGYRRSDFPGLCCLKPWLNNSFRQEPLALENLNFSTVWTFCFYSLKKRFFVLEYRKTHFPGRYWLKRKRWKNCELLTKTMGESFWKNLKVLNLNISTFWTSCFYSLERHFLVLEYRKTHFPGLYCMK